MSALGPGQARITPFGLISFLAACGCVAAASGCAAIKPAQPPIQATAYDIDVQLDPPTHGFIGHATLTLQRAAHRANDEPLNLDFTLNRALTIKDITADGAHVTGHTVLEPGPAVADEEPGPPSLLATHRVALDPLAETFTVTFHYAGALVQDVEAGERPGQIHNFLMAAHVGSEGIYLDSGGGWYPSHHYETEQPARGELADYRLTANPVAGMKLVASAALDMEDSARTGQLVWRSHYPLDGLALVGGPHLVKEKQAGDIHLALHYSLPADPDSRAMIERHTDLFLDAAATYLTRYPPLIGPFPFERFAIVENFFSSGFAFPEFTLLNRRLFQMGPRALMHGYLDHEILHSYWGNSIYVDPADGNWCEALTSYAANYYGYILDGDENGARNYRRNACIAFSNLKAENDQPLGSFGREGGPSREIGYNKGAVVFHMLARKTGQDNFWAALRRLTAKYTGQYVDWQTLQTVFEQQSGMKLGRFMREWVRDRGAPQLSVSQAVWSQESRKLKATIDQGETAFELAVPLRLVYEDGTQHDETVSVKRATATVTLDLARAPASVIVDPDYHVFRRLAPRQIMPTSKTTLADQRLLAIKPAGDLSPFYQTVIDRFSGRTDAAEVAQYTVDDLPAEQLGQQSLLILGDAVRDARVQALLARTNCPITWRDGGFDIEGTPYDQPGQSVFCTVHHPDRPGGGITLYGGNSEDALGRSDLLLFYRNSLVAFETTARTVEGEKTYKSNVILRRDFESPATVAVERE